MLTKIERRRTALGLSVRQLSRDLGVSHTQLSLALNGHRKPSKSFRKSMRAWLDTPVANGAANAPSTIYEAFISEKTSQVSPLTVKFYKAKLAPFTVWCRPALQCANTHQQRCYLGNIRRYLRAVLRAIS